MRLFVRTREPLPPECNLTYGAFKLGYFGAFCWVHTDDFGEDWDTDVEFVNRLNWASSQRPPDCLAYKLYMKPGVVYTTKIELTLTGQAPDQVINNIPFNLLTGKNVPVTWPPS